MNLHLSRIGTAQLNSRRRTACLALGVMLIATPVFADPVRVVTSGSFHTGDVDTGFHLVGTDFRFIVTQDLDPIVNCTPCIPGTALDLSTTLTVQDWSAGQAELGGQSLYPVFFRGTFDLAAGSVIVPDMPAGSSQPDGEGLSPAQFAPFTFTGTLAGYADPGLTGTPLFVTELIGGGTGYVRVRFENLSAETGVRVYQLDYNYFQSTAPVPEPGSLLLFGSGAAWIAARWRKRREET